MSAKPGMPYADSKVAQYLAKQIHALSGIKTQRQIAFECGYEKPNIISMFKRGETKVPIDRVPALAKALNVDPAFLFRLAMEQYWPDHAETIVALFGNVVSKNEVKILEVIRSETDNADPELTPKIENKLRAAFQS